MVTAPANGYESWPSGTGAAQAVKSEVYLNVHLYGAPDDVIGMDYFLWVVRNSHRPTAD